jgi:hypothetical protein
MPKPGDDSYSDSFPAIQRTHLVHSLKKVAEWGVFATSSLANSRWFNVNLHQNVKNFADKRDKGFPLLISSRPSLHGRRHPETKNLGIFLSGYFGGKNASDFNELTQNYYFLTVKRYSRRYITPENQGYPTIFSFWSYRLAMHVLM